MVCKNCGFEYEDEQFCPNCGAAAEVAEKIENEPNVTDDAAETVTETTVVESVTTDVDPGNGKATASMVLGIVSLVISTVCSCGCGGINIPISLITSIIGLVLSSSAKKLSASAGFKNGKANAGFITSIIALILSILSIFFLVIYIIFYGAAALFSAASDPTLYTTYY